MERRDLGDLLREADAAAPQGERIDVSAAILVSRVRRRRMIRRSAAVGLCVLLVATVVPHVAWRQERASVVETVSPAAQLDDLARRAELHSAVTVALIDAQAIEDRLSEVRTEHVLDVTLLDEWEQEVARAAAITWQHAEFLHHDDGQLGAAARRYREVAERFPETHWAELAGASLRQLSEDNTQQDRRGIN